MEDVPKRAIDQYLTGKVAELVPGALVLKLATGKLDPKTQAVQYRWVLQVPGHEDVVLGLWYDAARRAVKLYCRAIRAAQYQAKHADDYPRRVVKGESNGQGQETEEGGGRALQAAPLPAGEAASAGTDADHQLHRRDHTES